ncbi:26S proteasome regulatory subunit N1 [Senna tora]|uniref:26S proteasome regulatory subunit N1 n=1 Tax=Senna tora TaxID=362788 RepID=A0A834WHB8_9FABA|nr:26S proteasome regulatory subunit N1 [Senna tora]
MCTRTRDSPRIRRKTRFEFRTNGWKASWKKFLIDMMYLRGHNKKDFEVPLLKEDFRVLLPGMKLPAASKLPSLNLFNQQVSLKGLKANGAKLGQDVLGCDNAIEIVVVDQRTGFSRRCFKF